MSQNDNNQEEPENYCERHEVDISRLPSDYDHCPQCRLERDARAREMELMARRPPRSVDDPAPPGSYDAW